MLIRRFRSLAHLGFMVFVILQVIAFKKSNRNDVTSSFFLIAFVDNGCLQFYVIVIPRFFRLYEDIIHKL